MSYCVFLLLGVTRFVFVELTESDSLVSEFRNYLFFRVDGVSILESFRIWMEVKVGFCELHAIERPEKWKFDQMVNRTSITR
jgi:hypothetical protein